MVRHIVLLIVCALLSAGAAVNNMGKFAFVNTMEIVNGVDVDEGIVSDSLLKRLANVGYEYVLVEHSFWNNSQYNEYENRLRENFQRADKYGLKIIPTVNVHSVHDRSLYSVWNWYTSNGWGNSSGNFVGKNVEWNRQSRQTDSGVVNYAVASLAPGDKGLDSYVGKILQKMKNAYISSGVKYPLDYISLPGGEINLWTDQIMLGNGNLEFSPTDNVNINALISSFKRSYPYKSDFDIRSMAYSSYLAKAHLRDVKQVESVFSDQTVLPRVIIHGDMWDSQYNAGIKLKSAKNGGMEFSLEQIASLPGFTSAEKKSFRDRIVLAPWMYSQKTSYPLQWHVSSNTSSEYSAKKTFEHFARYGFDYLFMAIMPSTALTVDPKDKGIEAYSNNFHALSRYMDNSYIDGCIGYMAAVWGDTGGRWNRNRSMYTQDFSFDIIEILPDVHEKKFQ